MTLNANQNNRALIVGFFSTVGDIEVMQFVCEQLELLGMPFDVGPYSPKLRKANPTWVDISQVDSKRYSHLLVVCGPFHRGIYENRHSFFQKMAHCNWIGINLTMIEPIENFNPFDILLERDGSRYCRPDLSFMLPVNTKPLVGLCLVHPQQVYGSRQRHAQADKLLRQLIQRRDLACIELDTEWPATRNKGSLGSPEHFETVCGRLDVMLTTRLHGTVLALKCGVPVIALDAISGGDKVIRQARSVGWPEAFVADVVTDLELDAALNRCLHPQGRILAKNCADRARLKLSGFSKEFNEALTFQPTSRRPLLDNSFLQKASINFLTIAKRRIRKLKRYLNCWFYNNRNL